MALKPEERVVLRGEMETYVEAQMVEWVNRGIRNHIRKHHFFRWRWIRMKAHGKTILDILRSHNPAASKHLPNAIKEFFRSERSGPKPPVAPRGD